MTIHQLGKLRKELEDIINPKTKDTFMNRWFRPWNINKPVALPMKMFEEYMDEKDGTTRAKDKYTWTDWENETKSKWPIRYFLFDTIPDWVKYDIIRVIDRNIWKLRHRYQPQHKYHIVRTQLKPGYWDPITRMLYANMGMMEEFVEITKNTIAWDSDPDHAHVWRELTEIYDWWKQWPKADDWEAEKVYQEKLKEQAKENGDEEPNIFELEEIMKQEENEMLIRLIKIRSYLWYP